MATATEYAANASGTSWTNPTNANADDGSNATYTIAAKNTTGNENTLSNFGFDTSIPVGAVINSVQLVVEHFVSGTGGIAFLESAVAIGATTGTFNSEGGEPTSPTQATYSTVARPGGGSWTRADLLDGTFTVRLRARSGNSATSVTYSWDYARVVVDYTPKSTATSDVTTGNTEFAADATFTEAAVTRTATADLTTGNVEFASSVTFAWHPVGKITQPTFGIFGQRYGSFSGKQVTATSDLTIGGVEFAATASYTVPTFTATADLTTGATEFTASAESTDPVFTADASLTIGGAEFSADATHEPPVFTATADATIGGVEFSGSASYAGSIHQATADLITAGVEFSASATFLGASTATAALTTGGADFSAVASYSGPARIATASLTVGGVEFAALAFTGITPIDIQFTLPNRRLHYVVRKD